MQSPSKKGSQRVTSRFISMVSLAALFFAAPSVQAAQFTATGQVQILRSHSTSFSGNPDLDWFGLVGVTSLGSCPLSDGVIVFRLKDDARGNRQFNLVLAAKIAGAPITATVDDTVRHQYGHCFVQFLQ